MKKRLSLGIALFCALGLFAQNDTYKSTLHVGVGFSFIGSVISLADNANLGDINFNSEGISNFSGQFMGNSAPALQVSYDYGIIKWLSIGGGISYQRMGIDLENLVYTDNETNQTKEVGDVSVDFNRLNIGLRALVHYGNANKFDMYSGVRLGITNWGTKVTASNPDVEEDINLATVKRV